MATWQHTNIIVDGRSVKAQTPVIVSASRSTDIPAFYAEWFFSRLEKGYSAWTNPFNGVKSYVSYEKTRFIVFWSKNPRPLIPYLHILKERGIGCYIQYYSTTMNRRGSKGCRPCRRESRHSKRSPACWARRPWCGALTRWY